MSYLTSSLLFVLLLASSAFAHVAPIPCSQECANSAKPEQCVRLCRRALDDDKKLPDVNSDTMWDMYRNELIRFFSQGGDDASGLQLLSQPQPVEWDQDDEQFQTYANSRMTPGSTWSLDMRRFSDAYEDFLLSLKGESSPETSPQLEALYAQEASAMENYQLELGNCLSEYGAQNANTRGTFDDFKDNRCWLLDMAYQDFLATRARVEHTARHQFSSDKEYYRNKALGLYASAASKKFIELTPLSDFTRRLRNKQYNKFNLSIDHKKSDSENKSKWKSMGFSIGLPGFFSVGYHNNKNDMSLTTNTQDFKMKFGAQSYTTVRVIPDPNWFSGSVVRQWKEGPYKSGYSKSTFFGNSGKMSMIPQVFYIISKPHVELTLNRDDKEKIEKAKSSGFNFNVGFVGFNLGNSKTSSSHDSKNNLYQYTIESEDETPQLIAVKGQEL